MSAENPNNAPVNQPLLGFAMLIPTYAAVMLFRIAPVTQEPIMQRAGLPRHGDKFTGAQMYVGYLQGIQDVVKGAILYNDGLYCGQKRLYFS